MHASTTKRKTAVRCTAVDDDEDSGTAFSSRKRARASAAVPAPAESARTSGAGKRKAKEFAWMDSDDEASHDSGDRGEDEEKKEEDKSPEEEAVEENISTEELDKVQSFGRMMILAPSVGSKLRSNALGPEEVAAVCRALARVKFFDRELLDDLNQALRKLLAENKLGPAHTGDATQYMFTLNAYSREVCSAIARSWISRTAEVEPSMRIEWFEMFKGLGHRIEPDFLQLLEVPPVPPLHPNYKKVRCFHFSRDSCAVGNACTFSHDPRAPLSLSDGTREDWWKCKGNIMMTQNQKCQGAGSYGTGPLGVNPR